jgi:hypothetical protein
LFASFVVAVAYKIELKNNVANLSLLSIQVYGIVLVLIGEKVIYCTIRYIIYVCDHVITTLSLATILNGDDVTIHERRKINTSNEGDTKMGLESLSCPVSLKSTGQRIRDLTEVVEINRATVI